MEKQDLPKLSDRKQALYDWVRDNLPIAERPEFDSKAYSRYRKFELWDIVKRFKGNSEFYQIDSEAAKRPLKHRVLR